MDGGGFVAQFYGITVWDVVVLRLRGDFIFSNSFTWVWGRRIWPPVPGSRVSAKLARVKMVTSRVSANSKVRLAIRSSKWSRCFLAQGDWPPGLDQLGFDGFGDMIQCAESKSSGFFITPIKGGVEGNGNGIGFRVGLELGQHLVTVHFEHLRMGS